MDQATRDKLTLLRDKATASITKLEKEHIVEVFPEWKEKTCCLVRQCSFCNALVTGTYIVYAEHILYMSPLIAVLLGLVILQSWPGLKPRTAATGSNREMSPNFLSESTLYFFITSCF